MKLRHKVFLIYVLIAILPLATATYYSFFHYRQATIQRMTDYSNTMSANAENEINESLGSLRRALDFLTFYSDENDDSIIETMKQFADGPGTYTAYDVFRAQQYCDSVFLNLMYTNTMIQGIYIILPDSRIFGTSNDMYSRINYEYDCREDSWYKNTLALNGSPFISTYAGDGLFTDSKPSVYLAKSVRDVYSHKFLGVIVMDCDVDFLNLDFLDSMPGLALISVTNRDTNETLYSNVDVLPQGQQYTDNLRKADLVLPPLTLTTGFHYETMYREFDPSGILILAIAAICGSVALILGFLFTRNLIRPVEALSWSMSRQNKNGLTFISPYMNRTDEIGTLYNEYARMLNELNDSIQRDYRSKLILLDSQMKSLEARINSHFLFNTLESINSIAELNDEKEIADMSLALGNMFRYTIKTKSELVTLEDELKHVQDYVSIQLIRFSGRFRLITDIPEELKHEEVLKLILQPLVENALFHGLNYCAAGDAITVSARNREHTLYITVSDNGKGMDAETLSGLRQSLSEEASFTELGHRTKQSIGLKNIHSRIELYYGSGYGLTVDSTEGKGTSVTIRIPSLEKGL